MPVPPIILAKPFILVTSSQSTIGITSQTSDYIFGYVSAVYDTCDGVTVGETVLFAPKDSKALLYGSTMYYLVNEAHKLFKEPIAP